MSSPSFVDYAVAAAKGDLSSDYLAGGSDGRGLLPPSVAREFITATADQSDFLTDVNTITMLNPEHYVDVAGFAGRISFKDVAGVAMTEDQRSSLTIARQKLTAAWLRAGCSIDYHVENENIARMGLGAFIQAEMSRQVAVDLEESIIQGDTDSEDDGVDAFDGILKDATSYTMDYSGDPQEVTDEIFYALKQSMPSKALRDKANMRFYCSEKVESAYAKYLRENRNISTASFYEGEDPGNRIRFDGIRVRPAAMWPDTHIMLVHRMNVSVGMFIKIFLEQKHDCDPGTDLYVMRYAADSCFAEPSLVRVWEGIDLGAAASLAS